MNQYFSIAGNKIPIEFKSLYEEVSETFERKVMGAIKTKKENKNEKNKKISKESYHPRRLHKTSWERTTRSNKKLLPKIPIGGSDMEKRYSKLKEEVMDLFGTISIEEIVCNRPLSKLMREIALSLDNISIIERYNTKENI